MLSDEYQIILFLQQHCSVTVPVARWLSLLINTLTVWPIYLFGFFCWQFPPAWMLASLYQIFVVDC